MGCTTSTQEREERAYFETQRAACAHCQKRFGPLLWRHHCRGCGVIFCDDCASHRAPFRPRNMREPVRLCDHCFAFHDLPAEHVAFMFGTWQLRPQNPSTGTPVDENDPLFLLHLMEMMTNAIVNSPQERNARGAGHRDDRRSGHRTPPPHADDHRVAVRHNGSTAATQQQQQHADDAARLITLFALLHILMQQQGHEPAAAVTAETLDEFTELGWRPGDVTSTCAICQIDMNPAEDPNDTIRRLSCGHLYHRECVDQWLTKHSATCPQCRATVGPAAQAENGAAAGVAARRVPQEDHAAQQRHRRSDEQH